MSNRMLKCKICNSEFIFTDKEQKFYASKGLNVPKKCPSCKKNNKHTGIPLGINMCPECGSRNIGISNVAEYNPYNVYSLKCAHCGKRWNVYKDN